MKISDSCIYLQDLRFHAFHGVMEQEKTVGNDYIVNVKLNVNVQKAATSDNVSDTINYASVYDIISKAMSERSHLIEHVAYKIGEKLIKAFPLITDLEINVKKLNPPIEAECSGAGVEIHLINDKTLPC